MLLLHGNPGTMDDLGGLAERLAPRHDWLALDLPGFGRSPSPPGGAAGLRIEAQADDVAAALEALSWTEPMFVLGHSHGGGLAHLLAARHPRLVRGIVAIASLGYPAHGSYRFLGMPGMEALARALSVGFRGRGLAPMMRLLVQANMRSIFSPELVTGAVARKEAEALASRPEILLNMVRLAQGRPCEAVLGAARRVRQPCLYLHGRLERLVPSRHVLALHQARERAGLPSRFELLEGGHMLPRYQAASLAERIEAWVEPLAKAEA